MSGFLQLWFFIASFIPWLLIDRIGRRPLVSQSLVKDAENCHAEVLYVQIVASFDDNYNGFSNGYTSRTRLSGAVQDLGGVCSWYCWRSDAVHL